jgi:hypothetical protein
VIEREKTIKNKQAAKERNKRKRRRRTDIIEGG